MMQPIKISKSNTSSQFGSCSEENVEYGSIEGMAKIKQQNNLMELWMKEQMSTINMKDAQLEEAKVKTEHLKRKNERELKNKNV